MVYYRMSQVGKLLILAKETFRDEFMDRPEFSFLGVLMLTATGERTDRWELVEFLQPVSTLRSDCVNLMQFCEGYYAALCDADAMHHTGTSWRHRYLIYPKQVKPMTPEIKKLLIPG